MKRRAALNLLPNVHKELTKISKSRSESVARVSRAKNLLLYSAGKRISEISRKMKTNRPLIERTIDKALSYGPLLALNDLPRPGRTPTITDDAKNWVLSLACQKPTSFDYAHETWTYSLLILICILWVI